MRPIRPTLPILFVLSLGAPAGGRASAPAPAAASAATQALPLAELPAARVVASTVAPEEPVATAERLLDDAELLAASADVPDQPAVAEEIDKESAELEDLRRAEEESHVQDKPETPSHQPGTGTIALLPELDHGLDELRAEYDIPIDVNEAVVEYIRFFQSPAARAHFVKWLGRSHRYMDRYRAILKEEGLPADTVFLAMIESGFGNFAFSRAKASGPWQFIAATGKRFGLKQDFWVDERRDPEKSARAAARYLKELYGQTRDWRLAWAGYNAGVGRIFKARAKGHDDFWEMAAVPGRTLLRPETKGYVPKLMAAAIVTKHQEAFGFMPDEVEPRRWTEYAEVTIPSATLLGVLARAAGTDEKALVDLNPELRRACTPPHPYQLKIPKGQEDEFARNWPEMQGKVRMTFAGHVVRRGDTLSAIAVRYGVPVEGIKEMNGLRDARRLRIGLELIIPKPTGSGRVAAQVDRPRAARPRLARTGGDDAGRRAEPARRAAISGADRSRTTLRVQAGDTLWSISRRLGVELDELCRWNGIANPQRHKLLVGAQLVVYSERG